MASNNHHDDLFDSGAGLLPAHVAQHMEAHAAMQQQQQAAAASPASKQKKERRRTKTGGDASAAEGGDEQAERKSKRAEKRAAAAAATAADAATQPPALAVTAPTADRRLPAAPVALEEDEPLSVTSHRLSRVFPDAASPTTVHRPLSMAGQQQSRMPAFPPAASAAGDKRLSRALPPQAQQQHVEENTPLSAHRASMVLAHAEDSLPIAVAEREKRRSVLVDAHRRSMSLPHQDEAVQRPPSVVYAAPQPAPFAPSAAGIPLKLVGASVPTAGPAGGPAHNRLSYAAPAPAVAPHSLAPTQESAFARLARKVSNGRSRMSTAPPTTGGASALDVESGADGIARKRSLVRRDRAPQPEMRARSQMYAYQQQQQQAAAGGAQMAYQKPTGAGASQLGQQQQAQRPRATREGMRGAHVPSAPGGNGGSGSGPLPPAISRRPAALPREADYSRRTTTCRKSWVLFSRIVTFYALPVVLTWFGLRTPEVQQAWREKMALCTIIALMMVLLGFLTFAFNAILCVPNQARVNAAEMPAGSLALNGFAIDLTGDGKAYEGYSHNFGKGQPPFENIWGTKFSRADRDVSYMFQNQFGSMPECVETFGVSYAPVKSYLFPCTIGGVPETQAGFLGLYPGNYCHSDEVLLKQDIDDLNRRNKRRRLYVPWSELENPANNYIAFNGDVLDLSVLQKLKKPINLRNVNGINLEAVFQRQRNRDASLELAGNHTLTQAARCISRFAKVGALDASTMGCIASDVLLWVSLIVILTLVLSRFFMALIFRWAIAPKLGRKLGDDEKRAMLLMRGGRERDAGLFAASRGSLSGSRPGSFMAPAAAADRRNTARYSLMQPSPSAGELSGTSDSLATLNNSADALVMNMKHSPSLTAADASARSSMSSDRPGGVPGCANAVAATRMPDIKAEEVMHAIMLVTCYSEDEKGIRATLDSLAATTYQDTHKLMFVIADGLIKGHGNDRTTPEIIVSMMEKDSAFPEVPKPYSYVAIAEGARRHNMAQVHAGYYNYLGHRVPMVVVVKCGGPEEKEAPKPGNRGKRDSQVVLMSFLQKVNFDERMSPLEYDLFQKIHKVARVTPDVYECVLMVDADTVVAPDSLERMVACFARDHAVMGLCGETQIANKWGSPTTMIQVFEYYISHHLSKAFESVFGGVTCLPGCFCAYRIKSPKGDSGRQWVPILANPDVVDQYQENVVDTLHKKNLYLLGEDRYLSTLMLKTFPKRKMIFVPSATCETQVPDTFSVLLSQRRRWINSTIHNLFELVLVKDLCGTFCISMQMVVFLELVGTLVLPAAISFTIYLIVMSFITTPVPVIPLLLLAAILGLPGLLIILTSKNIHFLFWMIVYLISLPIWNFVLPAYAFWNMDTFTWGATRVIAGGVKDDHGTDDGEFDSSKIVMKRYAEWEQIRQRAIANAISAAQQAYRRTMMQNQYYGVENQLIAGGGRQYTV